MPNQSNFRSDVTNKTDSRFLASRVVKLPTEGILNEEIPGSFGYDAEDYIEIHFYDLENNELALSVTTKLSDNILKQHIVSYNDGTFKNYLQIDFTKLFVDNEASLIPGDYKVTLNFFSNEIGGYDDRRLNIKKISTSRTEVELEFNNETEAKYIDQNSKLFREFVYAGLIRADAIGVSEKIFTQGVESNDPTEGLLVSNIEQNLTADEADMPSRIEALGIKQTFDEQVNQYVYNLFEKIREEIIIKGDERIQQDELYAIIQENVKQNIGQLQVLVDNRIQVS